MKFKFFFDLQYALCSYILKNVNHTINNVHSASLQCKTRKHATDFKRQVVVFR